MNICFSKDKEEEARDLCPCGDPNCWGCEKDTEDTDWSSDDDDESESESE